MIGNLGLVAVLILTAVLLALEIRDLWRPAPVSSPVHRRYRGRAARPSLRQRMKPHHGQAPALGAAAAALFFLITKNLLFALSVGAVVWIGALYMLPHWQQRRFLEQARAELGVALEHLVVALRAGQSLPTALGEWPESLARALGTDRSILVPQLRKVQQEMTRGATAEEALDSLAERLRLEEMRMLAGVVSLCRRRGGDLEQPIAQAAQMLSDALDVRSQIRALTAGKRMEGVVLTLLPPIMLLVLTLVTPSYILPFIQSPAGRYILAVVLIMEVISFLLGRWLLQDDL